MAEIDKTMQFTIGKETDNPAREVIKQVCSAMKEKGYDPINQIVGYIVSGDPTYITSYNNARSIIKRVDKDELLEEFVGYYIKNLK
jgi:uncharacterized protein (UPF0297 family)